MSVAKRSRFDEGGVSLVEVMIGIMILAVALLGLAAAGGVAARQVQSGRQDMSRWAAIQEQFEWIVARGYDNVTDSSSAVQGYPMTWTVTGTDPKKVILLMTRENFQGTTVQDTFITYLANPN